MYWSFQFTSFIPLLQRALVSHLFLFRHSLNIYRATLRLVPMACKTSRKTPEGKDKTKTNPSCLQTTFLPKFCMSITWELLQTNTHYYSYLEGNKQENQQKCIPKGLSETAAKQLAHSSGKKNKTRNKIEEQNYKQTNPNKKTPRDHVLLIKCFAWTRIAIFPVLFLWAQEAYCRLMGNESSPKLSSL